MKKTGERNKEIAWLLKEKYGGKETAAYKRDLARLARGEPLAYVIGHVPFLGAHIDLSAQPLIPRAETEYWTEKALSYIEASGRMSGRFLDIFAGSGAIGIALARAFPGAHVDFGEKEFRFVKQIKKNLRMNGISAKRGHVYESDVFKKIPLQEYDAILANPPYVSFRRRTAQRPVKTWEPRNAVFAKDDGIHWIERLIRNAREYLTPRGTLFIEFDPHEKRAIEQCAKKSGFSSVKFWKDQYGRWRVAVIE